MGKIIDTNNVQYQGLRRVLSTGKNNGAYYYSKDIVKNIIPNVITDRPWDTLGMRGVKSCDRAIVFIHHNLDWDRVYSWLDQYKDQVFVCSVKSTLDWAKSKGKKTIYLPLSIDTEYVKQFAVPKTKDACYAGNRWPFKEPDLENFLPKGIDCSPANIEREELLKFIAPYRYVYAVGRTAIEARCLGANIMMCDSRYPDPNMWQVIDNKVAAEMLQEELDKIDGRR